MVVDKVPTRYHRLRRHHLCTEETSVPLARQPSLVRTWKVLQEHDAGLAQKVYDYCGSLECYRLSVATDSRFIANIAKASTKPFGKDVRLQECSYLNRALVARLRTMLRSHKPPYDTTMTPLTFETLMLPLGDKDMPDVLISGSMPLQVVLGETWVKSDVDVFCTYSVANRVRNILLDKYNMVCCQFWRAYDADSLLLDHVEGYAPRPSWYSATHMEGALEKGRMLIERYDIRDSINMEFPYDPKLPRGFLQLIVGKEHVTSPYAMIQSFDLNVCRTSFDGRAFTLPWETNIFLRQGRLMTRHDEVQEYLETFRFLPPCYIRYDPEWDDYWVVETIHRLWKYMGRGFVFTNLPPLCSHLHNHPVNQQWLVFDITWRRSRAHPSVPSVNASSYACPYLCGVVFDSLLVLRFHRLACHFNPHFWHISHWHFAS